MYVCKDCALIISQEKELRNKLREETRYQKEFRYSSSYRLHHRYSSYSSYHSYHPHHPYYPPNSSNSGQQLEVKRNIKELSFTAGYPNMVSVENNFIIFFYLHLKSLTEKVMALIMKRGNQFDFTPSISSQQSSKDLEYGTRFVIVPNIKGLTSTPSQHRVFWIEEIQELQFFFKIDNTSLSSFNGTIDVYTHKALIAMVPIAIILKLDKIKERKFKPKAQSAEFVERVFASYSREDKMIVDMFQSLYNAAGIEFYKDIDFLKSGDRWLDELFKYINNCNVFQLFWSKASSESKYVKKEWQHALTLIEEKGKRFIRPLYWEEPMPTPPEELKELHFSKIDI